MPREGSFWRNVALIGAVHLVVLTGLLRWSANAKKRLPRDVVWMEGVAAESAPVAPEVSSPAPSPIAASEPSPIPEANQPLEEMAEETPATKEIALTSPTPKPRPTAPPKKPAQSKPKPSPRPTPQKKSSAKAAPKPSATPASKSAGAKKQPSETKTNGASAQGASGSGSRGSGTSGPSQFSWYGNMLHDRFFGEWAQPKSIAMSGARMSALVRVRIEKDGRISNFAIVRSSGNVIVDESVAAIAKRVTQVDSPPVALINGGHYEVQINFELNPQ